MKCFRCDEREPAWGLICDECRTIEAEEKRRANLTQAERAYEDEHGREALARQRLEADLRFVCCGELRADGHHEECPNWKPTVHPAQESLA